jgi:hypothetical protein
LGEKLLALPKALDGSQLQPLLPFIGHVFERHVLNLTERCRNPTQIEASVWFGHWLPRNIWISSCWAAARVKILPNLLLTGQPGLLQITRLFKERASGCQKTDCP